MYENESTIAASAEEIAFQDIFKQHYGIVYGIARQTLRDADEAEEVAQEAFLRLYRKWPRLVITTSITSWLAKVTLNLAFNRLRGRKQKARLATKLAGLTQPTGPSSAEIFDTDEERQSVRTALSALKQRDRACLIARHSGLSYQEVADVCGIRVTSVGKTLARAELRFKQIYEQTNGRNDL